MRPTGHWCCGSAKLARLEADMFSMRVIGRMVAVLGMVSMLATAVAAGQAPPEQRIDIDELKAAIDGG
ncbi:uncharacterized protein METZ01_LOCUS56758, partial [marine metagenome]